MATQAINQYSIPEEIAPWITGAGLTNAAGAPATAKGLLPMFWEHSVGATFNRLYGDTGSEGKPGILNPYLGAGRVAGLTPEQQAVGTALQNMQVPGQYGMATNFANLGGQGLASLAGGTSYNPIQNQALNTYQMAPAAMVSAPQLTQYQMQAPEQFNSQAAQQYMSPYAQNVTDVAKRYAIQDAQKAQLANNLAAGKRGSLGSSSNILATAERERALGQQLGDIQTRGLESAYQNAAQMFDRDRAAGMTTQQANLQALLNTQQLGSGQNIQAQQLNQAALQEANRQNLASAMGTQELGFKYGYEAQRANQQADLQAQQQRMQAAQGLGSLASGLGQLGQSQFTTEMDLQKARAGYGDLLRNYNQSVIDAQYQDAQRQANWQRSNIADMANLLRGVPLSDSMQNSITTTPPPSGLTSLLGGLTAAYGGYRAATSGN